MVEPEDAPELVHPMEPIWRAILLGTEPRFRRTRKLLKHFPSPPRCKLCAAPFEAPFGPVMRAIGRPRWSGNSKYCAYCFHVVEALHGGAEIECTLLFADVRGSTALAEQMTTAAFRRLLDRFYGVATAILVDQDGIIDKYVGDEVVAIFVPALTQEAHASRAVAAASQLLAATGNSDPGGPWLPVGAGIATGVAFVGSVGTSDHRELTALGDIVNTAARLASAAGAGEILLTIPALEKAGLASAGLPRRMLDLKGKAEPVETAVLRRSR
jgi:adenylate cyclase